MPIKYVGTLTIHEPVDVELSHEVAAWATTLRLEPGCYPVMGEDFRGRRGMWAEVPGTVVRNYTPALFGGIRVGGGRDGSEEVGRKQRHRVGGGWYAFAQEQADRLFAHVGSFAPLPDAAPEDLTVGYRPYPVPAHAYAPRVPR